MITHKQILIALTEEAVKTFGNMNTHNFLTMLSEAEFTKYLQITIRAATVNRIFHKYALYVISFITNNSDYIHIRGKYSAEIENALDIWYIKVFHPLVFNSFEGFGSKIVLTHEYHVKSQFKENFSQKMKEFDLLHLDLMRILLTSRKTLLDLEMTLPGEKLDALLALEGFAFVCGPEFSGKSRFVHEYISLFPEFGNECAYIMIDKTTDLASLLGNYVISNSDNDAKFDWKEGTFVRTIRRGQMCILENFELATDQLKSFITDVIRNKSLKVNNKNVFFHHNFRLVIITRESNPNYAHQTIDLPQLTFDVLVSSCLAGQEVPECVASFIEELSSIAMKAQEQANYYKLKKLVLRLVRVLQNISGNQNIYLSSDTKTAVCMSLLEVFFENSLDDFEKSVIFEPICEKIGLRPMILKSIFGTYQTTLKIEDKTLRTNRFGVHLPASNSFSPEFVLTPKTSHLIETILGCVVSNENTLLIGETGCGKTTVVQELSKLFNKKLNIFNVSHSTDAFDLFGGYRPINQDITFRHEIDQIEATLNDFYSVDKNKNFLGTLREFLSQKKYTLLAKSIIQTCHKIIDNLEKKAQEWHDLEKKSSQKQQDFQKINECRAKFESMISKNALFLNSKKQSTLNLEFIKGVILQSIEKNEWLLLDEINLANEEVLYRLYQVLFEEKVYVSEASDFNFIRKHSDFRLFACMNPAFEVGKKPLPKRVKEGFTTINVSPIDSVEEIIIILKDFFKNYQMLTQVQLRKFGEFYCEIRKKALAGVYLDKHNKKIVFTLRQLRRATHIVKEAMTIKEVIITPVNSIYIGARLSFYLDLNQQSKSQFDALFSSLFEVPNIEKTYLDRSFYRLSRDFEDNTSYFIWQDFPIRRMNKNMALNSIHHTNEIVITPNIRTIICDLLRVLMYDGSRPILLEGPTSVGKTSIIVFLAEMIGQKVVRLNNHRDTDIDEYIGSYVPDHTGKIRFQEGVLLQCMRNGSWLLLDELNLARSEILEALNRVLDDNQELFVPELDAMIKPSPGFRIFATQNPNSYSGRSLLSTAFRNRFIVVNFESHNEEDLRSILVSKAKIPESRAKIMLKIMNKLETIRSTEKVFEGKEGLITIRDLLKWGVRRDENASVKQLARVGYFLLGERIRDYQQKVVVKDVISKESGIALECDAAIYDDEFATIGSCFPNFNQVLNKFEIKLNTQFKRLFVLANKAFLNRESVLLIGQTGCGKTTLAQMLADIYGVKFFSINCHKHTEVSDFLGGWKPFRNRALVVQQINDALKIRLSNFSGFHENVKYEEALGFLDSEDCLLEQGYRDEVIGLIHKLKTEFEWIEGNLVDAVRHGGIYLIDEISLANDSVLERLNSLLESTRELSLQTSEQHFQTISAHPKFLIIATMNPSGDYGKRELSPALRNRFTEVWATSILDSENFIVGSFGHIKAFIQSFSNAIIQKYITKITDFAQIEHSVVDFLFDLFSLINLKHHDTLKNLNMRDLTTVCNLFSKNFDTIGHEALLIASCVLFQAIQSQCHDGDLNKVIETDFQNLHLKHFGKQTIEFSLNGLRFENRTDTIAFGCIEIPKRNSPVSLDHTDIVTSEYLFEDEQIKQNTFKFLLGLQSGKPILLEGNPGIGKTSLIEVIGSLLRVNVYRIGLSEQTDLIDLLGSHIPDENNLGLFVWKDGLLLKALKEGAWIIFDELNLANQTILEGLNSILDHRGDVFLPDLNQVVSKIEGFRFFGTQNSVLTSKNRKGLPASFLNRFFKIYMNDFGPLTLRNIINHIIAVRNPVLSHSMSIMDYLFDRLMKLDEIQRSFLNIRFFKRVLRFLECFYNAPDLHPIILKVISVIFLDCQFNIPETSESVMKRGLNNDYLCYAFENGVQCYQSSNPEVKIDCQYFKQANNIFTVPLKHVSNLIFTLGFCLRVNFPVLLECKGKVEVDTVISLIEILGKANGSTLKRILLYKTADVSDLIGNYEQCNWEIVVKKLLKTIMKMGFEGVPDLTNKTTIIQYLEGVSTRLLESGQCQNLVTKIVNTIGIIKQEKSIFHWTFSPLMKSIIRGDWVLIQSCEKANNAILERLNRFLERSEFILNECYDQQGNIQRIVKHPNFRIFFTFNSEDKENCVPLGLQNRCFSLNVSRYLAKSEQSNSHTFRDYLTLINKINSYGVFTSDVAGLVSDERRFNRPNVVVLGYLAANLRENDAILGNNNLPELSLSDIQKNDLTWHNYIEQKTRQFLKQSSGFMEENEASLSSLLRNNNPEENILKLLMIVDKNKSWKAFLTSEQFTPAAFVLINTIVTKNGAKISTESIEKLIKFQDFDMLSQYIQGCFAEVAKLRRSETASIAMTFSDSEKLYEMLLLRTLSTNSPKFRIFTTDRENNPLFKILSDEAWNAKEKFIKTINPNVHTNFIRMIEPILKLKETNITNSLELEILSQEQSTSHKMQLVQEISAVYYDSINSLFAEYHDNFQKNYITILEEYEESNLTLVIPSEKHMECCLGILMNRKRLLMTDYDKEDEFFANYFPNMCEFADQFTQILEIKEWLKLNSKFSACAIPAILYKLQTEFDRILSSQSHFTKTKFSIGEFQLVQAFGKKIVEDFGIPQINKSAIHHQLTQLQKVIKQIECSRQENQMISQFAVEKDIFLYAVKLIGLLEHVLYTYEESNLKQNINIYSNDLTIIEKLSAFTRVLTQLVSVLDWSFKNQIMIEKSDKSLKTHSKLISEVIFELGYDRLSSAAKISSDRVTDKLHQISKRAMMCQATQQEMADFIFELFDSKEYLFNQFVDEQTLQALNNSLSKLTSNSAPYEINEYKGTSSDSLVNSNGPFNIANLLAFEFGYSRSIKPIFLGTLKSHSEVQWSKLFNLIEDLKIAYKAQIKSTGISEAAKRIKLEEQLERVAKYEYEKQTVDDNRADNEREFREMFGITTTGVDQPEKSTQNVTAKSSKFHKTFFKYWNSFLVQMALELGMSFKVNVTVQDYIKQIKTIFHKQFGLKTNHGLFEDMISKVTVSKNKDKPFLNAIELTTKPSELPVKRLFSGFLAQKQRYNISFNFYENNYDYKYVDRLLTVLNATINAVNVFYKDPAYSEMSSLNLLIKACQTVSEMKIESSLAHLCTAIEILQRNIDEFNSSLPDSMKLSTQRESLKNQLLELRRLEKHKWKDFLYIKKQELMNEDLGHFLNSTVLFGTCNTGMKMTLIDNLISAATLLTYEQRLILVLGYVNAIHTISTKRVLMNVIEYYASYLDDYHEKVKSFEEEIEKPMKNAMKLMNWHFEDIINIKMNVDKLYRGIHRSVKAQKEAFDKPFSGEIIAQHRVSILFSSIKEAHANFTQVIMASKSEAGNKIIAKKSVFLDALESSSDFKTHFTDKDIASFKIISAGKICELFGTAKSSKILKFKCNLLFKDELSSLMKNYLERMGQLAEEKKQTFIQRALNDFMSEMQSFGLKSRFNYQHKNVPQRIFESMQLLEFSGLPKPISNSRMIDGVETKLRKINLRTCRIVDSLKTILENQNFAEDLAPDMRDRVISYLFELYFRLCEHTRIVNSIAMGICEVLSLGDQDNQFINEKLSKILFLIDTNIELTKTESSLSQVDIKILTEIKVLIGQQKFSEAGQLLSSSSSTSKTAIAVGKELAAINALQAKTTREDLVLVNRIRNILRMKISKIRELFETNKNDNYVALEFDILKSICDNLSVLKRSVRSTLPSLSYDFSAQFLHSFDWIYKFNKFVYLMSLVFGNMIYKGFCIPKESDENDEQEKNGKMETRAGTGIGEGQGNQNVTDEIEFEEQVLGTKNEQKNDAEDEDMDPLEKDENEMDMENDFEGTTDRKKEGEDQNDDQQDQDKNQPQDEFSDVDDRKSDLQLFQDEEDEEEADKKSENLNKDDDLELRAEQFDNQREKLQPKNEKQDEKEIRDLDKDGVQAKEQDSEVSEMMEVESNGEQDDNEQFNEDLPSVKQSDQKDEDPENQEPNMDIENPDQSIDLPITERDENEEGGEEIEEELDDDELEENKEMLIEEEPEIEQKPKTQPLESQLIKDAGMLGAQESQIESGNFANIDQKDQSKPGVGGQKKQEKEKNPMSDLKKNLSRVFKQKLKIKECTVQKILEDLNLHEKKDEDPQSPENAPENPTDFEVQAEPDVNNFTARNVGLNPEDTSQLDPNKQNNHDLDDQDDAQKDPDPNDINIDSILQKREFNDALGKQSEVAKRVKTGVDEKAAINALQEYSQTQPSDKILTYGETILEDKVILHVEKQKLCEELKSILEQKKMSDLKGDYRTGKRLNMKRVISYIASNYRKDKIWLRRTEPNQQNYRIFISVDDSSSMK